MLKYLFLCFILIFLSCTSCSENKPQNDQVPVDNDLNSQTDTEIPESDEDNDEDTDDNIDSATDSDTTTDIEDDSETPYVDMYCPYPYQANFPYYREDKTIHFCRPCDTPDEYDPQCVKSLWKDLNKEVYDIFMAGGFEDNDWIQECYPWPCEWNVTSRTAECDTVVNPRSWAHSFNGYYKRSNMDNGKIMFHTYNYRINDAGQYKSISPGSGFQGVRAVMYDIETGKYTVIGPSGFPAYMNGHIIIDAYYTVDKKPKSVLVDVVPFNESYKYGVLFTDEDMSVTLDTAPFITDKWTVMDVNHYDGNDGLVETGTRSLVYSETGKWAWTTLAKGMTAGKAGGISVSGDNALFYHYGTNATWLCDLSKKPQNIENCKKVGREGELAGFAKFDRDNPNRVIYRSMVEGGGSSPNKYVILDISKVPWKIEKEFTIPMTETAGLALQLEQVRSNVLLYQEVFVMDASGYQEDGKLCFYRLDTEKVYCSKLIGDSTDYGHGHSSFEGKYLFWQPSYSWGYILRDMECYCEKEGVCPYEGMDGFPSVGVGN